LKQKTSIGKNKGNRKPLRILKKNFRLANPRSDKRPTKGLAQKTHRSGASNCCLFGINEIPAKPFRNFSLTTLNQSG
jgi:hypothetical protein